MQGQYIIQLYEKFQNNLKSRQRIRIQLDQKFQAQLDIMEYLILSKFQKNTKSIYKQKKNSKCDKEFKRGFKELLDIQKIYYYNMIVTHLQNISNQDLTPPPIETGSILAPGYSKTYSKIGWKQVLLKLDNDKRYLYVQKNHKLKAYNLNFFLLRKSKTIDYNSFVLQAIDQSVSEKQQQLHFGFKDVKVFRLWFDSLKKIVQLTIWQRIRNMLFPPEVVEILASKCQQEQEKSQKRSSTSSKNKLGSIKSGKQTEKMYLSSFTSKSHKNLGSSGQGADRMIKSGLYKHHVVSENQSDQKSIGQNSIKSIEINSQRSSLQPQNQMIECQLENQGGDETFRSMGLLNDDDIEVQNDGMTMFKKLLPDYDLEKISKLTPENKLLHLFEGIQIYSVENYPKNLKIFISFPKVNFSSSIEKFTSLICTPEFYKLLNPQIQQVQMKTILTTDNCVILYQKNKPFNRLYRSRDFVFVRHIFSPKNSNKCYIVDKSVQDNNVPPFTTIVRGQLTILYEIFEENEKIVMNIDAKVQNNGYLKDLQELNINIKFFKGLQKFTDKIKNIDIKKTSPVFSLPQKIINSNKKLSQQKVLTPSKQSQDKENFSDVQDYNISTQKVPSNIEKNHPEDEKIKISEYKPQENTKIQSFQEEIPKVSQKINEIFESVEKMQFEGEISTFEPKQILSTLKVVRKFDNEGRVILNQDHLSKHHITKPENNAEPRYMQGKNNQHPIWKGNWQFLPQGGLKFINQKQIEDQKGVLKFILSQVAKNLVSGKSILNISLPVDIFSAESNLQRFIFSMGYAPILLQPACSMPTVDRFLSTIIFGMTNSPLYLQMEKPFNPILGETFQCYINGCPAYAQQISHHPPIAAFMMVGRGYMVSAQIESKMKLNINSGTGSNAGVYRIRFDDGQQICYMSPSGQVSGLAYGDRKFNMIGKAYGWSQKSGLFVQIVLNPNKAGFFGRQETPIDYFEGKVLRVKQSFFKSFSKNSTGSPKKSQIIKQEGKFHGRWNKQLCYEERQLFSYDATYPLQLEYQQNPLPSDSNWRQDISYRRIMQITSAQTWKQKLQIQQRNQRKLRQKYTKK